MSIASKRRETEVFSLAFLDCICCGFGAVILVFILTVAQKKDVDRAEVDAARARLQAARREGDASQAEDRKSTRLNSSHVSESRMPSSA